MRKWFMFVLLGLALAFGVLPTVVGAQDVTCPDNGTPAFAVQVVDVTNEDVVVGSLGAGQEVLRYAEADGMTQVCANGVTGIVPSDALGDQPPAPVDAQQAQAADNFVLPTALNELADGIGTIGYVNPDQVSTDGNPACYERSDMNESCSTLERQAVSGVFTLGDTPRPGMRLINGDVVELRYNDANGDLLVERIPTEIGGTNGDMYILMYDEGAPEVNVYMDAPNGSFRGDFTLPFPQNDWGMSKVVTVVGNQVRLLLINSQPALEAWTKANDQLPYPELINPANCSTVDSLEQGEVTYCDAYNLYVLKEANDGSIQQVWRGVVGVVRDDQGQAMELATMEVTDDMIAELLAAG